METKLLNSAEFPTPNLTAAKDLVRGLDTENLPDGNMKREFVLDPAEANCSLGELRGGFSWLSMRAKLHSIAPYPCSTSETQDGKLMVSMSSKTLHLIRDRVLLEDRAEAERTKRTTDL